MSEAPKPEATLPDGVSSAEDVWAETHLELMIAHQRNLVIIGMVQARARGRMKDDVFQVGMAQIVGQYREALFRNGQADTFAAIACAQILGTHRLPMNLYQGALKVAEVRCLEALVNLIRERQADLPDCLAHVPPDSLLPAS